MASVKLILKKKPNPEGLYPVYVQILKNRLPALISTNVYLDLSDWNDDKREIRKSYPNSSRLNNYLDTKKADVLAKVLEIERENSGASATEMKNIIEGNDKKNSFASAAKKYLDILIEAKKHAQLSAERPTVNHFKKFLTKRSGKSDLDGWKNADINIEKINVGLLREFATYLNIERKQSERTIINNLKILRSIIKPVVDSNEKLKKDYPFGKGKIQIKFPETKKEGLEEEELQRLELLELQHGTPESKARDIWLFAYYFAGMRISDVLWLTWPELSNGRLHYIMNKNGKVVSLVIPPKAKRIIAKYRPKERNPQGLVFDYLKHVDPNNDYEVFAETKKAIKEINGLLTGPISEKAEIYTKLTTHISRHTFGHMAGDKIHPKKLQKLYRHTSLITTINYQSNFIYEDVDDALLSIVGEENRASSYGLTQTG